MALALSTIAARAAADERSPLPATGLPVKPRLRGHLHQWALATFFVAGIVLIALAHGGRARFAAAVYALTVCLLYGTSALYHRRTWKPKARAVMKRLDHSMILVLIAGTYTPVRPRCCCTAPRARSCWSSPGAVRWPASPCACCGSPRRAGP